MLGLAWSRIEFEHPVGKARSGVTLGPPEGLTTAPRTGPLAELRPGRPSSLLDEPGKGRRLGAGQTYAVEPMVCLGSARTKLLEDHWTVVTADGSLAAHTEHTIAITDGGPEILTLP